MLLSFLLALGCRGPEPPRSTARGTPDLLIVTVDTLRADRLGAYGYADARTPVVDALSARGVRFDQATTTFPRTTPALASLLTGLEPAHHGSREVGQPRTDGVPLAEVLAGRGYATAAVSATRVAGPRQHLDTGFQRFEVMHDRKARRVSRKALELAGEAAPEAPLFLWVHYADPHFPYEPPRSFPGQPEARGCRKLIKQISDGELPREALFSNRDGLAAAALVDCSALYDAEIAYTDAALGDLLQGLESLGRLERTLVVFSADHGENLGEDGLYYEHGPSLHDASLRVPLIVAGPGVSAGHTDRWPVTLEDVAPTAMALLGVAEPERPAMDGRDLSPRLAADQPDAAPWTARVAFSESGSALHETMTAWPVSGRAKKRHCANGPRFSYCRSPGGGDALHDHLEDPSLLTDLGQAHPEERQRLAAALERWPPETARLRAARVPGLKLVETPVLDGGYRSALYDLELDPLQRSDAGEHRPADRDRLQRALDDWTEALPPLAPQERDRETEEALRALGYLE